MANPFRVCFFLALLLAWPPGLEKAVRADDDDDRIEWAAAFNEGEASRQKGDYRAAAKSYERALELAPRLFGPGGDDLVANMNNLGLVYKELGEFAKAERLYLRCLKIREAKLGPDHLNVAQSLNNLGALYSDMGHYAKAEPLYRRSLKIREAQLGPNHPDVAESLNNLGVLYAATGRYSQAEPLYQRGVKIIESQVGPNDPQIASPLCNLGVICQGMGKFAQAEANYRRSLKIREAALEANHPDIAASLTCLANLFAYEGQYPKAEPLFERSRAILVSQFGADHPEVARILYNMASLYVSLGQYAKGEAFHLRSLKIREDKLGRNHPDVAESLNGLAHLYDNQRQFARSEPLYQRSLQIAESASPPRVVDQAWSLKCLAYVSYCTEHYAKAESLYLRSLKLMESALGPDTPDVANVLVGLGVLYTDMRQFSKAEPLLDRSLKIYASKFGPDHPNVVDCLDQLVALYALMDRWREAIAATEKERRIVRRYVAHTLPILSEREQLAFLQHDDEGHLHNSLTLGLQERADPRNVLLSTGWILNGKAVAQECLAQRTLLTAAASDPALADFVKQLLAIRSELAAVSLTVPKPEEEAEHRQRLQTLSRQEQELSRQFGQAAGRGAGDNPWVEVADVRKAIPQDAVLIEVARFKTVNLKTTHYADKFLPPRYAAWIIPAAGQGEISIVDLGDAKKIEAAVQAARKELDHADDSIARDGEAKAEGRLRDAMRELARLVFEPLEKHLGSARQLLVSPDAALWLVPWSALPLADGKYAVEKYQFRYCTSGRYLVGRTASSDKKSTNPVVFANPDYDLGPQEAEARTRAVLRSAPAPRAVTSRGRGTLSSLPKVARLPGTADEAAAIKPTIGRYAKDDAVVYEDQYALEGVFKALASPRVLVLCTHGFFLADHDAEPREPGGSPAGANAKERDAGNTPLENPLLRCGLLLAGCNRPAGASDDESDEDGILTGLEIVGTDLRGTDLVVLSACETGLGQIQNGEGVAGLRQAFQLAGAGAVVSTLWKIPDEQTVDVMNLFFVYLSQGQSKAAALRNAQLALIKARRAEHSAAHPFYWAAFTMTGE